MLASPLNKRKNDLIHQSLNINLAGFLPVFPLYLVSALPTICKFWEYEILIENQCLLFNWAMNENCKISQYRDLTFAGFYLFQMVCKVNICETPVENQCFLFYWGINEDRMLKQSRYMKFAIFYQFFLVSEKSSVEIICFWQLCDTQTCFTLKRKFRVYIVVE